MLTKRGEGYTISTLISGSQEEPPLIVKLKSKLNQIYKFILKYLPILKKKANFLFDKRPLLTFIILTNFISFNSANLQNNKILLGDYQSVKQTLNAVDQFTPLIKENSIKIDIKTEEFISKPNINKTTTRYELDRQKKAVLARERTKYTTPTNNHFNGYLYGFCTWYVANVRTDIPSNWGNAKNWLRAAQNINWPTGDEPRKGAIVVTNESWAGHVGYVESVNENSISISEMNKIGWNRQSSRVINKNSDIIKGYIY